MSLYISLFLLFISSSVSTVINVPGALNLNDQLIQGVEIVNIQTKWLDHLRDFIKLIDAEKVLGTVFTFIDDPEAMKFVGFLLSPKFKEIIWEIEIMDEFQEAYLFLEEKGYDMRVVIDEINSDLNLPPFKPQPIKRYENNVSGFLAAMIGSLPIDEMKTLFNEKLKDDPEFRDLFEVVTSSEFREIMKRMISNPKISELKNIFESYGVDFDFVCEIFKELFIDYNGIFCP